MPVGIFSSNSSSNISSIGLTRLLVGAPCLAALTIFVLCPAGKYNQCDLGELASHSNATRDFVPVHLRHGDVEINDTTTLRLRQFQRFHACSYCARRTTETIQQLSNSSGISKLGPTRLDHQTVPGIRPTNQLACSTVHSGFDTLLLAPSAVANQRELIPSA